MKTIARPSAMLAAVLIAAVPASASAQETAAVPERGAAWYNAQFLALATRAAEGWYALPGGALWRRVKGDGTGAHPTPADTVRVHYEGTLVDGTKFDSSFDRGQPATFPLRGLIPAWTLAIPQAGVGDTIEIAAPADLAYGQRGVGPIPAGATLLFKVELLEVVGR